jgi:hypothetical protein
MNDERELTKFEEESLQDWFVNEVRELGGRGITKDNYEDMFEVWYSDLSWSEIDEIVKHYTNEEDTYEK